MPYCRCGNEYSDARAQLGFDCCLECGEEEAAAEIARRAQMIAPISHKSGYTYLGPDSATQRRRLLVGSAKTRICRLGVQARQARRPAEARDTSGNLLRLSRPRRSGLPAAAG